MKAYHPDVILKTNRLTMRFLSLEDTHDIFVNINHDRDVLKYFIDRYCENESEMNLGRIISIFKEKEKYVFALIDENNEVIGMILEVIYEDSKSDETEIGFAIGKKHWNKGYVTEASEEFIRFLTEIGYKTITAGAITENLASKRVIEKLGMKFKERKEKDFFYRNQYFDVDYYFLLTKY